MDKSYWAPVSKTVARQIEKMISEGAIDDDGRLPSQRELSTQLGVSRTSVREALSQLEASGMLRTEPGRGTFWLAGQRGATQRSESGSARSELADIMRGMDVISHDATYPKLEISRFRYLIESQSARLAAMRISDDQIQLLERNLSAFKSQTRAADLEASAATDFEFHHMIVRFAEVRLFADMHRAFRPLVMHAVRMYETQYNRAWEPVVEHERILEALRRRDPDEARYYMQSHIIRSAERLGITDASEIL
ncbi:MAG: FCD domain-containing protein [Alphaproteobacteria bacterium]